MSGISQSIRRWKPSLPYVLSAGFHVLILLVGGHALVSSAEFGMEIGDGGMAGLPQPLEAEVELYEEPPEMTAEPELEEEVPEQELEQLESPKPPEPPKPQPKPVVPKQPPRPAPTPAPKTSTQGTGSGGAYMALNKPSYLRNPPPPYPSSAKRQGQQGLVVLQVYVSAKGRVDRLHVSRSSGYPALDQAAEKTVSKWRFRAAKIGGVKVKSKVVVPVRLKLD